MIAAREEFASSQAGGGAESRDWGQSHWIPRARQNESGATYKREAGVQWLGRPDSSTGFERQGKKRIVSEMYTRATVEGREEEVVRMGVGSVGRS